MGVCFFFFFFQETRILLLAIEGRCLLIYFLFPSFPLCVYGFRPCQLKLEDAVQLTVGNDAYMLFPYDKVSSNAPWMLLVVLVTQLFFLLQCCVSASWMSTSATLIPEYVLSTIPTPTPKCFQQLHRGAYEVEHATAVVSVGWRALPHETNRRGIGHVSLGARCNTFVRDVPIPVPVDVASIDY